MVDFELVQARDVAVGDTILVPERPGWSGPVDEWREVVLIYPLTRYDDGQVSEYLHFLFPDGETKLMRGYKPGERVKRRHLSPS